MLRFLRKIWYRFFYSEDELQELINEEVDKFNFYADQLPEDKDLIELRKEINSHKK